MAKSKKAPAVIIKTADLIRKKALARAKMRRKTVPPKIAVKKTMAQPEKNKTPAPSAKKAGYGPKDLEFFKEIILAKKKEILEEL